MSIKITTVGLRRCRRVKALGMEMVTFINDTGISTITPKGSIIENVKVGH